MDAFDLRGRSPSARRTSARCSWCRCCRWCSCSRRHARGVEARVVRAHQGSARRAAGRGASCWASRIPACRVRLALGDERRRHHRRAVGRVRGADRAGRAAAQGSVAVGGRARHERRALRPRDVHPRRHHGRVLQAGEGSEPAAGAERRGRRLHVHDEQPARRRRSELRGGRERGGDLAQRQAGRRCCIRRSASIACRRTR